MSGGTSAVMIGAAVISAAVGAYGAIQSSEASSAAAKYQSQVAEQNAQAAQQNASWAEQAGNQQAEQASLKMRAMAGAIKANQAASGVDVNSGSASDVQTSSDELGQLDVINIRANAARTAFGYENQAAAYKDQSQLDQFTASNDITAGYIGATSSIVGGVGQAAFYSSIGNAGTGTTPTTDSGSVGHGTAYPSN